LWQFREPVYKNPYVVAWFCFETIMALSFNFSRNASLLKAFQMKDDDHTDYRVQIFLLAMLYGALTLLYERYGVPRLSMDEDPVDEDDGNVCRCSGSES
jgi:hypothetical protein